MLGTLLDALLIIVVMSCISVIVYHAKKTLKVVEDIRKNVEALGVGVEADREELRESREVNYILSSHPAQDAVDTFCMLIEKNPDRVRADMPQPGKLSNRIIYTAKGGQSLLIDRETRRLNYANIEYDLEDDQIKQIDLTLQRGIFEEIREELENE